METRFSSINTSRDVAPRDIFWRRDLAFREILRRAVDMEKTFSILTMNGEDLLYSVA